MDEFNGRDQILRAGRILLQLFDAAHLIPGSGDMLRCYGPGRQTDMNSKENYDTVRNIATKK